MHKVACYGTLRKNCGNHRLLDGATFIGTGRTKGTMYKYCSGFPAISLEGKEDGVVVEVYEVNDAQLLRLDQLEGYHGNGAPNFYDRSLVSVKLDKQFDGGLDPVWIYHIEGADMKERAPVIESGDWVCRS